MHASDVNSVIFWLKSFYADCSNVLLLTLWNFPTTNKSSVTFEIWFRLWHYSYRTIEYLVCISFKNGENLFSSNLIVSFFFLKTHFSTFWFCSSIILTPKLHFRRPANIFACNILNLFFTSLCSSILHCLFHFFEVQM